MNVGKMMKMRTYIDPCSSPARWRWRDRGAVGGEGSFHTREGRGRLDHRINNAVTAMLPATPRDDHRSLVNLDRRGVIHLWMETLQSTRVRREVLRGVAVEQRERRLRLTEVGRRNPHRQPHLHVGGHHAGLTKLHRERDVTVIK